MLTKKHSRRSNNNTVKNIKRKSKIKKDTVGRKRLRKKNNKTRRGGMNTNVSADSTPPPPPPPPPNASSLLNQTTNASSPLNQTTNASLASTQTPALTSTQTTNVITNASQQQPPQPNKDQDIKNALKKKLTDMPFMRFGSEFKKQQRQAEIRRKRIEKAKADTNISNELIKEVIQEGMDEGSLPTNTMEMFERSDPSSDLNSSLNPNPLPNPLPNPDQKKDDKSEVNMDEQLSQISQLIEKMNGTTNNSSNPGAKYSDCPSGAREIIIKITTTTDGNCVQAQGVAGICTAEAEEIAKKSGLNIQGGSNKKEPEIDLKIGNMVRYIDNKRLNEDSKSKLLIEGQSYPGDKIEDVLHKRVLKDMLSFLSGFNKEDKVSLKKNIIDNLKHPFNDTDKNYDSKKHTIPFDLYYYLIKKGDKNMLKPTYTLESVNGKEGIIQKYVNTLSLDFKLELKHIKSLYDSMSGTGDTNVRNIVCSIKSQNRESPDVISKQNRLFTLNSLTSSVYCYLLRKMYGIKFDDDTKNFKNIHEKYLKEQKNNNNKLDYNGLKLIDMKKTDKYNFTMIILLLSKIVNNEPNNLENILSGANRIKTEVNFDEKIMKNLESKLKK